MKNIILPFFLLLIVTATAQDLDDLDSYTVDEVYQKIDLDYGTLDDNGHSIDHIYTKTEIDLSNGLYEIEITDGPNDLYQIKGTDIYLTFRGYYGYAGYADECILEIKGGYYNALTVYKVN